MRQMRRIKADQSVLICFISSIRILFRLNRTRIELMRQMVTDQSVLISLIRVIRVPFCFSSRRPVKPVQTMRIDAEPVQQLQRRPERKGTQKFSFKAAR